MRKQTGSEESLEFVFNVGDLVLGLAVVQNFSKRFYNQIFNGHTIISTFELLFSTILGLVEVCSPE